MITRTLDKIFFVSTLEGYGWGGSEELWSQAARILVKRGASVGVCVKNWDKPVPQVARLKESGCQVKYRRTTRRFQAFGNKLSLRSVEAWLKRSRPELVVISLACHSNGVAFASLCSDNKIPYALVVQAAGEHAWPVDEELNHLSSMYRNARVCYFVSKNNQRLVERQFGLTLCNAAIVRNPFKVPYDVNLDWPSFDNGIRLACVGRLHPASKGQDILFDVLKQDKWRQRDLHISLVGSGPNEQSLEALRKENKLDKVSFVGSVSDVTSIWDSHHALILPSRYEGLPLVLVEAMLCGRPCIVTDVAGNTELVDDNLNGFVAAAPTAPLLDEALERAWRSRAEWQDMGRTAACKVREAVTSDPATAFADELMLLKEKLK